MNERAQRRAAALDALVDDVALKEFHDAEPQAVPFEVAIVIAAYKEADNIKSVVSAMPSKLCDRTTGIIVVVDGEDDGTGSIVRSLGSHAVMAPVNRGQGAALRLGYRLARELGATYIVTADADGQTDPNDLETCLWPVVRGEADFVNGSRRLGRTESNDAMRNLGVVVYAAVISALTRTKVTDTANPIRAMRAELTGRLCLQEPQYQASELLLSAIFSGARYCEQPVTMRARKAGASKKGSNVLYGYRYGKVVLRTYLRELRARRLGVLSSGTVQERMQG